MLQELLQESIALHSNLLLSARPADCAVSEAEAGSPAAELPFHAPNVWPGSADAPLFKPALLAYRDALLGARNKCVGFLLLCSGGCGTSHFVCPATCIFAFQTFLQQLARQGRYFSAPALHIALQGGFQANRIAVGMTAWPDITQGTRLNMYASRLLQAAAAHGSRGGPARGLVRRQVRRWHGHADAHPLHARSLATGPDVRRRRAHRLRCVFISTYMPL